MPKFIVEREIPVTLNIKQEVEAGGIAQARRTVYGQPIPCADGVSVVGKGAVSKCKVHALATEAEGTEEETVGTPKKAKKRAKKKVAADDGGDDAE